MTNERWIPSVFYWSIVSPSHFEFKREANARKDSATEEIRPNTTDSTTRKSNYDGPSRSLILKSTWRCFLNLRVWYPRLVLRSQGRKRKQSSGGQPALNLGVHWWPQASIGNRWQFRRRCPTRSMLYQPKTNSNEITHRILTNWSFHCHPCRTTNENENHYSIRTDIMRKTKSKIFLFDLIAVEKSRLDFPCSTELMERRKLVFDEFIDQRLSQVGSWFDSSSSPPPCFLGLSNDSAHSSICIEIHQWKYPSRWSSRDGRELSTEYRSNLPHHQSGRGR